MNQMIDNVSQLSAEQCIIMGEALDSCSMPKSFIDGHLVFSKLSWWCSGFFPGTCWYSWLLSGNSVVKELAETQTSRLLDVDSYYRDHDIGFQVMCSAGNAYKHTGDEKYLPSVRRAAELLASRYSSATGAIKSWDNEQFSYPVIIDNMMNLELLTFASRLFGEKKWMDIAVSHADISSEQHFRDDNSSYHMVEFDPGDGHVVGKRTHQGYNDESAWSRGQAWGLYGFTMMYRETGLERFLGRAESIANFLLPLLSSSPVPAWDFNAPEPDIRQVDASAAAIMASALLELSTLTKDTVLARRCLRQAENTLLELGSDYYLAQKGECGGFILKHSTGHYLRNSEVDVPLTYADYYFLEALYRYKHLD
ncbi:MAG: glycoside hydrolase family 88 protein [Bacteroidales bacterium]|nr:glycoside hydrolase family 88 protein [Bacteroidales bacterium]MBR0291675.1 glycoside hydrolase family 88 protein [Bacteroidales bacterium]